MVRVHRLLLLGLAFSFLLALAPPSATAQPAENPCPDGQVYVPEQDVCIPEDELPPDGATEDPFIQPSGTGGEQSLDEAEQDLANVDMGNILGIELRHFACDAGVDPRLQTGDISASCTGASRPAFTYTVTIRDRFASSVTMQTGDGTWGAARFESTPDQPMPEGPMIIAMTPVTGWEPSWVTCTIQQYHGAQRFIEPPISGNAVTLELQIGDTATCAWFNVATGPEDQNAVVDPGEGQGVVGNPLEPTGAAVSLSTYLCPAGTTATDDLVAGCTQRASGMVFSLVTPTETLASQTSDADGGVFFPDVAPGDYGISAVLPAGYGEPIVVCYHAFASGIVEEGGQDIVLGNQFRFTVFGAGESLECAWYNVPAQGADDGPNIFIEARTCNAGTPISPSMSLAEAQNACQTFYIDLEFSVLSGDQVVATAQTNADFLSPGQVFFTKLPLPASGIYGIIAGVREGERTLTVFCDQDFGDGNFQIVPVQVSGNRLDQELGMLAGDTMRCTWFIEMSPLLSGTHVPEAPAQESAADESVEEASPGDSAEQDAGETLVQPQDGQASPGSSADDDVVADETAPWEPGLTVLALLCPANVAGQDLEFDLTGKCPEPAAGLSLDLLIDDVPAGTYVTNDRGEVDLPVDAGPGEHQLQIRYQPAQGQLELRAECTSLYEDGTTATGRSISTVDSPLGQLYLTYDGISRITCTFNFVMNGEATADNQPEQGAPGDDGGAANAVTDAHSVTIQFWNCQAGVSSTADQEVLRQVCSVETQDRSFMLTIDNTTTGETIPGTGSWDFHDSTVYRRYWSRCHQQRLVRRHLAGSKRQYRQRSGFGHAARRTAHGDRIPPHDHRLLRLVHLPWLTLGDPRRPRGRLNAGCLGPQMGMAELAECEPV